MTTGRSVVSLCIAENTCYAGCYMPGMEHAAGYFNQRDVPANDDSGRPEEFFSVEFYDQARRLIEGLTRLGKGDPNAYTPRDVYERIQYINEARDSELYAWTMKSNESDWKRSPSFYHALLAQLLARGWVNR